MVTKFFSKSFLLGATISLFVAGCSSDDGTGNTAAAPSYGGISNDASLRAANAEEIMLKGTESVTRSVNTENDTPSILRSGANGAPSDLLMSLYDAANQMSTQNSDANLPIGAVLTGPQLGPNFCGGSISFPDNFLTGGLLNGTVTLTNLCYNTGPVGKATLSGTIKIAQTSANIMLTLNITAAVNGESKTFNSSVTCNLGASGRSSLSGCSISSDYVGADDKTYRVSNVSVTGSSSSGYSVSATFYHPDYGKLTVATASALLFNNCSNGKPSSGTLTFSSADGGTASITFDSCTSYSYSYTVAGSVVTGTGTW